MTPVVRDVQDDDSDVYVLGLRDSEQPDAWSLLFMESDADPDAQDMDLDMDTYCLVVGPGQATEYGGILECELSDEVLRLRLTGKTANTLGLLPEEIIPLVLSSGQRQILRSGLLRILASGRPDQRPALIGF